MNEAIKGGLQFIAKSQLKNGGFEAFRLDKTKVARAKKYQTTFVPSLTALSLKDVSGSEAIQEKIAQFLLKQKSSACSWNYWDRFSDTALVMPYPDDLDASFVALAALWHSDPDLLKPGDMAQVANVLFAAETTAGGPYRTWLVEESANAVWKDVDLVVNTNIAYFLFLQGVELPRLNRLFETALHRKDLRSPYYPPLYPAAYFLSRFYKGKSTEKLKKIILNYQLLGTWETPQQTAMAVSSLLKLKYPASYLERAIEYILQTQLPDGSWPTGPICRDVMYEGEHLQYFIGSASLTTALCLEALSLYERAEQEQLAIQKLEPVRRDYQAVVDRVRSVINSTKHVELKHHTEAMLDKIITNDTDKQIVMLPKMIARSANIKTNRSIEYNLAVASLWGWMAYTIYDDFLDNEGDPKLLPSALFCSRHLLAILRSTLADNKEFQTEIEEILVRLEGANAWEVDHCRGRVENGILTIDTLPDYGNYWQLADRSLGHIIAGLGVLYGAGFTRDAPAMEALREFFIHYLIARQLNDDAHDWEEDLARGHVNAVGVLILQEWSQTSGQNFSKGIHLKKQAKTLRLIMWEKVIDEVCAHVYDHLDQARAALNQSGANFDSKQPFKLLLPLQNATDKALKSRDEAIEFSSLL